MGLTDLIDFHSTQSGAEGTSSPSAVNQNGKGFLLSSSYSIFLTLFLCIWTRGLNSLASDSLTL